MGCTSSTTNLSDTQPSTTDNMGKNSTCEESTKENDFPINTKEIEQRQVLPENYISNNEIQIASDYNNKSNSDDFGMNTKDFQDNVPTENYIENIQAPDSSPLRDVSVCLKVVVEKVISEPVDNSNEGAQITIEKEAQEAEDLDRQIEEILMESNTDERGEVELVENEMKDSPSPTQSEDSRATRWEALADIAAELPPSLAVDPLTGQIYSLTK